MKNLVQSICAAFALTLVSLCGAEARQVVYIHGDIAADGTIPSGAAAPFHQMLLTDTGNRGCSMFRELVEAEAYTIAQYYDQATTLDEAFLASVDVIIFGLHQKIWSTAEKAALDAWIRNGGGILMYSDSAAGGSFQTVGIKNATGQIAVNNILTAYGMQVTVDQGGGTRAYISGTNACNPVVWDQPEFEGEGVSPVAVDLGSGAEVLIPFDNDHRISGGNLTIDARNITLANPTWASLALHRVGKGNVMAIFDRQPVWNDGEGSSIQKRDNHEVLRRIVKYLARDLANDPDWFRFRGVFASHPSDGSPQLQLQYRQWQGGSGITGVDYRARNTRLFVELSPGLDPADWNSGTNWIEQAGIAVDLGDGTVWVSLWALADQARGFARLRMDCDFQGPMIPLTVDAGGDALMGQGGTHVLNSSATGGPGLSLLWTKLSGPGPLSFADDTQAATTVQFGLPGTYVLQLLADDGVMTLSDTVRIGVVSPGQVTRAINCGGAVYTGQNGFSYEADALFTGGHIDAFPGNAVERTEDDALYNFARSAHSAYTVPVVDGDYLVLLQMAETFFTGGNSREFDVTIEGDLVIDDLDLVASAPGRWVAADQLFPVSVNDGVLNLGFTSSVNNALLNGLVIVQTPVDWVQ